jgi:hypothetical protein
MVKNLFQIPHVEFLTAGSAGHEVLVLVGRVSADALADDGVSHPVLPLVSVAGGAGRGVQCVTRSISGE